jgi:hypothetical protein
MNLMVRVASAVRVKKSRKALLQLSAGCAKKVSGLLINYRFKEGV